MPDYELLELILFAAHPRGDVKPLAKRLIKQFGSFACVIQAEAVQLQTIEGMGEAAITAVKAVEASATRLLAEKASAGHILSSWTALLDYLQVAMASKKIEQFRVLFLDKKNTLLADEVLHEGTVDHTPVYPREILKRALELSASALILVHNHPSGDPTPSKPDIEMTSQIVAACLPLNIRIHDHVIIGKKGHYSFKSSGLL